MLKSYSAIYKQGHLEWLDDAPEQENVPVIVTFVETNYPKPLSAARRILEQALSLLRPSLFCPRLFLTNNE